jgi:hypothetical protein
VCRTCTGDSAVAKVFPDRDVQRNYPLAKQMPAGLSNSAYLLLCQARSTPRPLSTCCHVAASAL